MNIQVIQIEKITLEWSGWHSFSEISLDVRNAKLKIPDKAGVYEVIPRKGCDKKLTIGQTSNLRDRIRQGLVSGTAPHSTGKRIRKAFSNADFKNITWGKAGRIRHLGFRPSVRGMAMNPVDHPHGGGEGRSKSGSHPRSPWGKGCKGTRTRKVRRVNQLIIKRRKP